MTHHLPSEREQRSAQKAVLRARRSAEKQATNDAAVKAREDEKSTKAAAREQAAADRRAVKDAARAAREQAAARRRMAKEGAHGEGRSQRRASRDVPVQAVARLVKKLNTALKGRDGKPSKATLATVVVLAVVMIGTGTVSIGARVLSDGGKPAVAPVGQRIEGRFVYTNASGERYSVNEELVLDSHFGPGSLKAASDRATTASFPAVGTGGPVVIGNKCVSVTSGTEEFTEKPPASLAECTGESDQVFHLDRKGHLWWDVDGGYYLDVLDGLGLHNIHQNRHSEYVDWLELDLLH